MLSSHDDRYLQLIVEPIKVCASYRPKFGMGRGSGLTLPEFQKLYQADPFYAWFGLDNPLMYAAHKAAGGMTSVYRQIGIGCEKLFRQILCDHLGLSDEAAHWSYTIQSPDDTIRALHLDARIPLGDVHDDAARKRVAAWIKQAAGAAKIAPAVLKALEGAVFEVRQGYKSKDSKRQNADISNAATAYANAYLPCAAILSAQIDADILQRYRAAHWLVLTGVVGLKNPLRSTYDFMAEIVGFDLAGFFERHSEVLRSEVDDILRALLIRDMP